MLISMRAGLADRILCIVLSFYIVLLRILSSFTEVLEQMMEIKVFRSKEDLAQTAATQAASLMREAISRRGIARIIAATGASQFDFLDALTRTPDIDWSRVEMFHLDEYVGMPESAPASFCRYLRERLINKVALKRYHLLDGTGDPRAVIKRVSEEIRKAPIDVAFAGVGENGHLAFNDPPANFDADEAYIVVDLDEDCRKQQLGEGWFPTLARVPRQALSMTIRQLMKAEHILCIVPDARKAKAIRACFGGDVSPMAPASILQRHPKATIYLDQESSALLPQARVAAHAN
jgi:glucosamine-6-phosphate deaminase